MAAYILPMAVFGLLTAAEGWLPPAWYVPIYILKIAGVTAAVLILREPLADVRPSSGAVLPSVLVGIGVLVAWVGLDHVAPYPRLGERAAFNPFAMEARGAALAFLAVRLYGLVLLVPLVEELFWRSFLLRYFTSPSFRSVPIGRFSASACALMVVASAIAHPEWLAAAVTSLAYALWLRHTGSLFAVIVAHAATNAGLGAFVLATGAWRYW